MKRILLILLIACSSFAQVNLKGNGTCKGKCSIGAEVVTVTTTSLPAGTQGTAYSQTLVAVGGLAPYTWALVGGTPPTNTALSSSGVVAGTPTASGAFAFTVTAMDQNGVVSSPRSLSITINAAASISINNTSFSNPALGAAYNQAINVTGGTPPYTCTVHTGSLPTGVTISGCALTATSVGGSAGTMYTFSLHAVDSVSNATNSGTYTVTVVQPCGPPNYGCAGRAVVPLPASCTPGSTCTTYDNCVLQIFGGGASTPAGCPPTNTSIPNLHNGFSTCTQGTNCTATDPQYNNILMVRCTDGTMNGTITSGTLMGRPIEIGAGTSGDIEEFTTDSSLISVYDTGNRFYVESYDTTNHTCFPIMNGTAPWLSGPGEFGGTTKGNYYSFFYPGQSDIVNLFNISCTTPGHSGTPCAAPVSSTVVANFGTVFPNNTATQWTATTSYTYGDYVFTYLTNSQSSPVTAASCSAGTVTYTLNPGLSALAVGNLFSITGLTGGSGFNGTALTIVTTNAPGTIITASTGCSGSATGLGTLTEGSNVLFQNVTSGTHTSGGTTPSWNSGAGFNTTDGATPITWVNVGTTNFPAGWTTIGGVSVDETQISAGFSNNNFDSTAKGALNVSMTGNQNTGFYVYTYDSTAASGAGIYYEWNTMTGIAKSFTCTASTGPQCTRASGGVTVLGQVNPAGTTPCTNVAPFGSATCQFYIHNDKIYKGGTWSEVTPEFCTSTASGPGNCPSVTKFLWSKGTTTVNMSTVANAGHETERFVTRANFAGNQSGQPGIGQIRTVTASNTVGQFWINPNSTQLDGHWSWNYLNGSTNDSTITPIGGSVDNTVDFPYKTVYESEVLIIPACGLTGTVTTPACGASELQNSQVAREGHTYCTGSSIYQGVLACVGALSQDGTIFGVTTDYACQFGPVTGGTLLCGFPWSASFAYTANTMIAPTSLSNFQSTNPGNFVYQTSSNCTSGTTQPKPFNQTVGGTTTDGTCTWLNLGIYNGRSDVVLYILL